MVEHRMSRPAHPPLLEQNGAIRVRSAGPLIGEFYPPGDKSISHRALLLGALADGTSTIANFLPARDCLATLACLRSLGVHILKDDPTKMTVVGSGLNGLNRPVGPLDCVRSGTTMRLLAGIMAGQRFASVLTGDPQLLRRPMRRVVGPLRTMGAEIEDTDGHGPLKISGRRLVGQRHDLVVASAQVKSALLLAGLYAQGPTVVHQPGPARDHTERMLIAMGAQVTIDGLTVSLEPPSSLAPLDLMVPGDISSAAFLLIAGALIPGSRITALNVGLNPTRTGLLEILVEMGAALEITNRREQGDEPVADVTLSAGDLRATEVGGDTVVRMIDEFPALAVAVTQAEGTTHVRDAAELRVKETDRIATVVAELTRLGARIEPRPDGFVVEGPTPLQGAVVDSHGDHRLAMALVVAGLLAEGETVVLGAESIADSFPGFLHHLEELTQ
jgi:3-phosphoshikimate 1-carboxyvinyltransferase